MTEQILTQAILKEHLHYNPDTGVFTWLVSRGKSKFGKVAGSINTYGYTRIQIFNKTYLAHRLAFLYEYGIFPKECVDHRNGVRTDNRMCNLREATNLENAQNLPLRVKNKSGFTGVCFHIRDKKWVSQIKINGKMKHLGYFDDPELASQAYIEAKRNIHTFNPVLRES